MAAHDAQQVQFCMEKFKALEEKMDRVLALKKTVEDLDECVFNHGSAGLKTILMKMQGVKEDLAERRKRTLAIWGIVVVVLAVVLAWPVTATWHIVADIIKITQEWDQIHKVQLQNNVPTTKSQLLTSYNQTQDATNHEEVRPWQLNR